MTDCSICFNAINAATGRSTMSCGHEFHMRCLARWFTNSESCPLCRKIAGPLERNATDPEICIPCYLLDTFVKGQGGSGIPPEMDSICVEFSRQELDTLFIRQGGRRFNDAQWSVVLATFAVDSYRPVSGLRTPLGVNNGGTNDS